MKTVKATLYFYRLDVSNLADRIIYDTLKGVNKENGTKKSASIGPNHAQLHEFYNKYIHPNHKKTL